MTELSLHIASNLRLRGAAGSKLLEARGFAVVETRTATPPGSPVNEAGYLVIATATGVFATHETAVARYNTVLAAFDFLAPIEGDTVYVKDEDTHYTYTGAAWTIMNAAAVAAAVAVASAAAAAALAAAGAAQTDIDAHEGAGGSVHAIATTSAAGFMSASDKTAVDALAAAGPSSVPTRANKNMTASVTASDFDEACAAPISVTPASNSYVSVFVNGLLVNLRSDKTGDCYFSADGGTTARAIADIEAGDLLYWVGSVAEYELDASDVIDFLYNAPAMATGALIFTERTMPGNADTSWNDAIWDDTRSQFIAVGGDDAAGSFPPPDVISRIAVSPDGLTWTELIQAGVIDQGPESWIGVAASPSIIVVTPARGDYLITSADGVTWTTRAIPATTDHARDGITYSSHLGLFIISNSDVAAQAFLTSPDGITWTLRTAVNSQVHYWPDASGNRVIAPSYTDGKIEYSDDAVTWHSVATPANMGNMLGSAYSPELGLYALCGWFDGTTPPVEATIDLATSSDGATWLPRTSASHEYWYRMRWASGLGRFFACCDPIDGTYFVQQSADGITWTGYPDPIASAGGWWCIAYSPTVNRLVVLSYYGRCVTGDAA